MQGTHFQITYSKTRPILAFVLGPVIDAEVAKITASFLKHLGSFLI